MDGLLLEALPRAVGVLLVELRDLRLGEVAQRRLAR